MTSISPIFALSLFAIALISAYSLTFVGHAKTTSKSHASLDGLRGILAVSVFIHHSSVWYTYLHSSTWKFPESNLFNQLGHSGVELFFMISSFLFVDKLLQFEGTQFDWKSFYMKRFFRLAPLHFVLVAIIILIVFTQSDWQLQTSFYELFSSSFKWLSFGTIGFAEINGTDAAVINAGVLWSISYEWLLYFSLPILAIFISRAKPNIFFILIGIVFIVITSLYRVYEIQHLLSFLGGAIAPFILRYQKRRLNFNSIWFTLLLIFSISGIFIFHSPENLICKLLLTIAFTIIALGNNFFGLLEGRTLRLLGEISYSIYLIHGIILFILMHYVVGWEEVKSYNEIDYCLLVLSIVPIVVIVSLLAHRFIEKPLMR